MKKLFLLLMFCSGSASAGGYLDVAIAVHDERNDGLTIEAKEYQGQWSNPLGIVEAGWGLNASPVSVFFLHISSFAMDDRGFNAIGVKYRLFGD